MHNMQQQQHDRARDHVRRKIKTAERNERAVVVVVVASLKPVFLSSEPGTISPTPEYIYVAFSTYIE